MGEGFSYFKGDYKGGYIIGEGGRYYWGRVENNRIFFSDSEGVDFLWGNEREFNLFNVWGLDSAPDRKTPLRRNWIELFHFPLTYLTASRQPQNDVFPLHKKKNPSIIIFVLPKQIATPPATSAAVHRVGPGGLTRVVIPVAAVARVSRRLR